MKRPAWILTVAFMLTVGVCAVAAQDVEAPTEKQMMKQRQKEEREALKQREKNLKEMMASNDLPKAQREQAMHQLKREERQLKEKQKEEREDFKDRQRQIKEINANVGN
jgi:uncharacterized protein HemX